MKKIFSLLLVVSLISTLCACGSAKPEDNTSVDTVSTDSNSKKKEESYVAYKFNGTSDDALTIEEVVLMPKEIGDDWKMCEWKMKVRNTSGEDLKMKESSMRIWFQYLDENGDKLFENYVSGGYSSTIKDGDAEWIEESSRPGSWTNEDVEKMAAIKIYAYTTTLHGSPDFEFSEPIIINIKDYFEW